MDLTLIHRCQVGDIQAFGQLFEENKNLVFRTACLMLDDVQDAEDVLQDVFIKLHRSIASYDPNKAAISTWLYRITINHCLNLKRHRKLIGIRLEDIPEDGIQDKTFAVVSADEWTDVKQALRKLSMKQRSIIILRYLWGLSYAEISNVMNLPLGTVKSRLNLSLQTLKRFQNINDERQGAPAGEVPR